MAGFLGRWQLLLLERPRRSGPVSDRSLNLNSLSHRLTRPTNISSRCPSNRINSLIVPSDLDGALLRSISVAPDAGLVSVIPEVCVLTVTLCCGINFKEPSLFVIGS